MSLLSEERKVVEKKDFSDINKEERERMTRVSDLVSGEEYPVLRKQLMNGAIRIVKLTNPEMLPNSDMEMACAMIMGSACNAIHYLLENDVLEWKEK